MWSVSERRLFEVIRFILLYKCNCLLRWQRQKNVARFSDWLNIPFHYFKVSLVVWKPKRSNSPQGYPDISALRSYLMPLCDSKATRSGISRAEGLAARASQVLLGHLQPTLQPRWVLLVGSGRDGTAVCPPATTRRSHWGELPCMCCYSTPLWTRCHLSLQQDLRVFRPQCCKMWVRIFKSPYDSKTSFGCIAWWEVWGPIPQDDDDYFEGQGHYKVVILLLIFFWVWGTHETCSELHVLKTKITVSLEILLWECHLQRHAPVFAVRRGLSYKPKASARCQALGIPESLSSWIPFSQ